MGLDKKKDILLSLVVFVFVFFPDYYTNTLGYLMLIFSIAIILTSRIVIYKQPYIKLSYFLMVLFVLIILGSSFISIAPSTSIKTAILTTAIIIYGILIQTRKYFSEYLIYIVLIGGSIHSFFTLIQILFPTFFYGTILPLLPNTVNENSFDFLSKVRMCGITSQTGINSFFISLGIIVLFVKSLHCSLKLKFPYYIIILLSFVALFLTGRRGPLLAVLIASMIIYCFHNRNFVKVLPFIFFFLVAIYGLLLLLAENFPFLESTLSRFLFENDGTDLSSGRFYLYQKALSLYLLKPLTGIGFGTFAVVGTIGVHNVYIQLLAEIGPFGLLFYLLWVLVNFFISISVISYLKKTISYFILAYQIYYVVMSCFESCLTSSPDFIIYVISVGISYKLICKRSHKCI